MTTIAPHSPELHHPALRATLAMPQLRESLRSLVRRRVPRQDADDVLQAVLCDALAAENVPQVADEIPRWLMAIARHKVADFHRRASRERVADGVEARSPFDPVEERDLLSRVAAAESAGSAGETLRWAVREWTGVPLSEIAVEVELPAEVVRQRVSRLRRKLRAKWLMAIVALLAIGVGAHEVTTPGARPVLAVSFGPHAKNHPPTDAPTAPAPAGNELDVTGKWHIAEVVDASRLDPTLRAFVMARAPFSSVELLRGANGADDRLVVHTPAGDREATVRWTEKSDAWRGKLTYGELIGSIEVRRDGAGIVVTADEGPMPGTVRLAH